MTSGTNADGKQIFLRDIWPSREDIQAVEKKFVIPSMFKDVYSRITDGNESWNKLEAPEGILYPWDAKSTYIKSPPFFDTMVCRISRSSHQVSHSDWKNGKTFILQSEKSRGILNRL